MNKTTFRELEVWKMSLNFVVAVYELSRKLPKNETYGLSSQIQRASVSIPSNIAEGSQKSKQDFRRYCLIARGSAAELETELYLVEKIYKLECSTHIHNLHTIQKMLARLAQSLKA